MSSQEIYDYVMKSPANTNPNVLGSMLKNMDVKQVQVDWNQNNETAVDFIKNRPFYIAAPTPQVITKHMVDAPKWQANSYVDGVSYCSSIDNSCITKLVEGENYTVILNGTQYELTAIKSNINQIVLGNPYLQKAAKDELDTGEDFCIRQALASRTLFGIYFCTENLPETVSLSVSAMTQETVQLDEKFINYKPGRIIKKGEKYNIFQADGTRIEKEASGGGEIFNFDSYANVATGQHSHAEGQGIQAIGSCSHAEGKETFAAGGYSHTEGFLTYAGSNDQHVQGKFNIIDTENKYAHIVGNGSFTSSWTTGRSNAHTLDWSGNAVFSGTVGGTGADYAEYFEWADGNPNNEDRVGLIVTLDGEKIRLANAEDEVLGIISGTAMVLGDNAEWEWRQKYIVDDYGRPITEMVEEFVEEIDKETGELKQVSIGFYPHRILNPDFDPEQDYIRRSDRAEWAVVGLLGKIHIRDDGTCVANGYATVGANGVATASTERTNMRVMKRISENVILAFIK